MPKKSKKSKKHDKKSEKKAEKHKRKYSDSSNSSESDSSENSSEGLWTEKICDNAKSQAREDWMSETSFIPTYSLRELKAEKDRKKKQEKMNSVCQPGQSSQELNPYWKNGGTGLPEECNSQTVELKSPLYAVGDHGAEWLKKALHRAKEQAKEEKRPLDSIVAERYGSLDNLHRMIKKAEAKSLGSKHDSKQVHSRFKNASSSRNIGTFMRPSEDSIQSYDVFSGHSYKINKQNWRKSPKLTEEIIENRDVLRKMELNSHPNSISPNEWKNHETSERESSKTISAENEIVLLTDEEMNSLASKILKAEILGNTNEVKKLTEKLNNAREAREVAKRKNADDNIVLLTGTNARGSIQPIRGQTNSGVVKKQKTYQTYVNGERVRYFEDDEKYSLNEMFEREHLKTAADSNAEFVQLATKSKADKDYDIDDLFMEQTISNKNKRENKLQKAISKQKISERALDNCTWCLTNNKLKKHLIIATGSKCYLSIPYFQSLTENHCLLAPIYHSTCTTLVDEDVWEEIKNYCSTLTRMFRESNQDVVFFEYAMNFKYYPHMVIHCVPIPYESGNLAPIYFKKAILECEKEWAQNKKLIDVKKLDVKRVVPKGLPYFMVHFGMDYGFAHVIEDEKYFPKNFAQEIIGGMLDLDHSIWRKQCTDDIETQFKKVNKFKTLWNTVGSDNLP